jgi:hypothetical protein
MLKIDKRISNIKEEFEEKEEKEEKETSKNLSIHIKSNNSQENSNKSKSKESQSQPGNQNQSIHLFKHTSSSKNSSSQKLNQRYNNTNEEEKNEKTDKEKKDEENLEENKNAECAPKFMQINPHFNIFTKQIDSLRESIYDDTKRCLILKGSLQQSSNFLREESNGLIKEIVEKIYNLRELFENGNKGLNQTTQEVQEGLKNLKDIQSKARKEIINCDKRITKCEDQIGYKLLGNPSYSFMKNINDKNIKTQK